MERAEKVKRAAPVVMATCVEMGVDPAGSWERLDEIMDRIPPEWRCAPRRVLRDALVLARKEWRS